MTPEVSIGSDCSGELKVENKGHISDHPSEKGHCPMTRKYVSVISLVQIAV